MRARSLKPSLFKNELLGTADPRLTILFAGLWCEADRDGRLEDRPLRIRAEVFPYRTEIDIDAQLQWLNDNGFIKRYVAKGLKIIQVFKFSDHQRPHTNEVASVLPTLEEAEPTKVRRTSHQGRKSAQPRTQALRSDSGLLTPSSLTPDSGLLTPDCLMVPSEPLSDAKPPDDVREVFEHWKSVWQHPSAALDPKRRAAIGRALKGYSVADLCESIAGYRNSTHHTGQNDRNAVYDGLHLLLRDADHIDAGLRFAREPPELSSKLQQHNVAVLQDWRPQELRDADPRLSEISGDDGEIERDVRQRTLTGPH